MLSVARCIFNLTLLMMLNFSAIAEENSPFVKDKGEAKKSICNEALKTYKLSCGWYLWQPYQFEQVTQSGYLLSGMDVELNQQIASNVGYLVEYQQIAWHQHQNEMKEGKRDMAAGATYTEERAKYANFSIAYRFEENSLFMRQDSKKELDFDTVSEFLAQARLQNFVIGVTDGFIYADQQINLFIDNQANQDIIVRFDNDKEALDALIRQKIDGFISDRVVGASAILNSKTDVKIEEVSLGVKTPIHLMFSKKTVPIEVVESFNREIHRFKESSKYKTIVKTYLYPVMLLQTIDSDWFYLIGVIGTFAFAISGVAIAAKDNATLFGTFLFAMLPSVGGGIMRDILVNRKEVGIFLTPSYMYYILIVVLVGFSTVRLLEFYNKGAAKDSFIVKFWDNILIVGDALGQAAFIVTGVSIAIMAKIEPIELWGPFFAFLSANGGGILRDLLRKKHKILCLTGALNAEIAVIWGFIFSVYLNMNSYDPDPTGVRNAVIIVAIGAFVSRLVAYYFKIPNIKFRNTTNEERRNDDNHL